MKARIVFVVVLVAMLLLPGGATPALADGMSGITGGIHFMASAFGIEGWMRFDVHATKPGDSASGWLRWQEYSESNGWRRLVAHSICVTFGESQGAPAAVFVVQIDSKSGWGDGEAGQYILFWVRDGGTPGRNGDRFTTLDWPPQWTAPACEYREADFIFATIDEGNLVIHR
jgi:hypothetical protein